MEVERVVDQACRVNESRITFITTNNAPGALKKRNFVGELVTVVNETLEQIFKEEGAAVIKSFLERTSKSEFKEIVGHPEVFSAGLERMLGTGAPVIETIVLKNLCSKLGLAFEEKDNRSFPEYLKELKADWRR